MFSHSCSEFELLGTVMYGKLAKPRLSTVMKLQIMIFDLSMILISLPIMPRLAS